MSLKVYKMAFDKAHFGDGNLNDSVNTFDAGRLFSALTLEAIKVNKLDEFQKEFNDNNFILSDAFPILDNEYYIPKPIGYPKNVTTGDAIEGLKSNRKLAKKTKSLNFIPLSQLKSYLNNEWTLQSLKDYNTPRIVTQAIMKKGEDPYEVGVTSFDHELYVIANQSKILDELMLSLQYSGIGGKRSSGYGQFKLDIQDLPRVLEKQVHYDVHNSTGLSILLTTSMPQEDELTTVLEGSHYLLKKSSGFAYSTSSEELLRKQDFYKFKSGSTFKHTFKGIIKDVRPDDFSHPVWNFAKGLFLVYDGKVGE